MMEVEKPWEFKEEVDIMEEEQEEEGLQTRERKKKPMPEHLDLGLSLSGHANNGQQQDGEESFKAAEEAAQAHLLDDDKEEEHKSVFFDPTKVSDNVTEVSAEKEVTEAVEDVSETSSAEGTELQKQENVNAQETDHKTSNCRLENGSNPNGVHESSSSSEAVTTAEGEGGVKLIATIGKSANNVANWGGALDISNGSMNKTEVHEIEVEKDEHVTKGKVSIEEYDLEKILDEQETHDLYCPNCNSCITRRVILRKRKRTVRQAIRDEPPKKPQLAEPSANASNQTAAERHDQEAPDVFRCLSCFTFFIPTGCGFNIFRIFERRDVDQQVQVQHPSVSREMSDNCGSWLLSCFQTVDSPKKPADAGSIQTETGHVVTVQQDRADQEKIPLSKPAGNTVTDSINPDIKEGIQQNTTSASDTNSFFNQAFFNSEVKIPIASPTKILSEVGNLTGEKPTSVVPQQVQPEVRPHLILPVPDVVLPATPVPASTQRDDWDILKVIVYGGLVESITSLSVVSAAAASGAKTLDIFIMGIANLIGGLPIIYHNIADLKNIADVDENDERVGHYWLHLGRRSKYRLHMFIAILSYILFGLLPPVIYGLSFRESDNRENKMMVVAAASLACVALLAIGKAHVKRPRTYITTLLYYLSIGLSGSGLSYVAGVLITRFLAHFGLIDQGGSAPTPGPALPSMLFPDTMGAGSTAWASY